MKKYIIFALVLFSLKSNAQETKEFTSETLKFKLQLPSNWVNNLDETGKEFFMSPEDGVDDLFNENINVLNKNFSQNMTVVDFDKNYQDLVNGIKPSFENFILISHKVITHNNIKFFEVVYEGTLPQISSDKMLFTQRFAIKNEKLYIITFTETPLKVWHTTGVKILDSFKFY